MEPQDYWQAYVGSDTPLAFMGQYESNNPERCVEKYMSRLPHLFGIVRRQSWQDTFAQEDQLRAAPVAAALTAHLEATREDWEPALDSYRKSLPKHAKAMPDADQAAKQAEEPEAVEEQETAAPESDASKTDAEVDTTSSVEEVQENLPEQPDSPPQPGIPSTPDS